MPSNYDSTTPIIISKDIIGDGFIDYLNSYAAAAKRKGAKVFFSFSPMNSAAVKSNGAEIEEFYKYIGSNLNFPVISDINKYILPQADVAGLYFTR
jgi:hypothetical protein